MNQFEKILNLLSDNEFHCTSEMAALYMIDYRRRLVDLKEKGYQFENRRCTKHNHPMKEWRLKPSQSENFPPSKAIHPKALQFLKEWQKPEEKKELNKQLW